MVERYEDIRDNSDLVPQDVRVAWIEAGQSERFLRDQYARIAEDPDLNDEAKARKANELYEGRRGSVENKKQAARDGLIKAAKSAAKSSIPRPSGESTSSTDPTKLLLDQNKANRIVRIIERRKDQAGPFNQHNAEYLQQEYKRGIEVGGVEGGSICRGVLRAAGELGLGDHWLPRNDRQNKLLDDARRLEYFSELISTKASAPPKSLQKRIRGGSDKHAGRAGTFIAPNPSGPPIHASVAGHAEGGGGASKQESRASKIAKKKSRRKNFS